MPDLVIAELPVMPGGRRSAGPVAKPLQETDR